MKRLLLIMCLFLIGCATTNSIPYKASTDNIISIQQSLKSEGKKVRIGNIELAPGVEEKPLCRLLGPVNVAPGISISQYIKDAFKEELFKAEVYDPEAPIVIDGRIDGLSFSSISPAKWEITMAVKSNISNGYSVKIDYRFKTSWDAYSACKNVANAFGPAVQELLKQVVTNSQFKALAKL